VRVTASYLSPRTVGSEVGGEVVGEEVGESVGLELGLAVGITCSGMMRQVVTQGTFRPFTERLNPLPTASWWAAS
jgi:hypothetical protein